MSVKRASADQGPVLVIGNSDGIGKEVTRQLLDSGRRVIGASRSNLSMPGNYKHHVVDVTTEEFPAFIDKILNEEQGLQALIHCAAVGSQYRPDDLSRERRCFDTNLISVVEMIAAVVPKWKGKGGHIVVLSSLADKFMMSDAPSYCASKKALSAYLEMLNRTLRPEGVSITNVRFGFVDTKLAKSRRRPLLMTREKAARVVIQSLIDRPEQISRPRRAAMIVELAAIGQAVSSFVARRLRRRI